MLVKRKINNKMGNCIAMNRTPKVLVLGASGYVGKATQLKFTPDLRFRLDETFDQFDETRRLLGDERVKRDL